MHALLLLTSSQDLVFLRKFLRFFSMSTRVLKDLLDFGSAFFLPFP